MISANGGLPAHRYTPQVTQRWPRGSEPASTLAFEMLKLTRSTFSGKRSVKTLQKCNGMQSVKTALWRISISLSL